MKIIPARGVRINKPRAREFKLDRVRLRRVQPCRLMYLGGSLCMAGPDIQMNDRMPRTCSSPEAYSAGAKLNETTSCVRPLVSRTLCGTQ